MESLSFDDQAIDDRQRKLDYRQRDRFTWLKSSPNWGVFMHQVQNPAELRRVVRKLAVERRQQRFVVG